MPPLVHSPYPWHETLLWPLRHARPSVANPTGLGLAPLCWRREGPEEGGPRARLAFLGDLMRYFGERLPRVHESLRQVLGRADRVLVNCEGPVIRRRMEGRRLVSFTFDLAEDYLAGCLEALGVAPGSCTLGLANNHTGDHGGGGLEATLEALGRLGLGAVGTTGQPLAVVEAGPWRIGLAAWTQWENRPLPDGSPRPWRDGDVQATDWAALRAREGLHLLAGAPHWGWEFEHFPRAMTRALAARLLGSGFDLLVGHHPHVLQGIERAGEGLCFYSLGNLYGVQLSWPTHLGAILEVTLAPGPDGGPRVEGYELFPFFLLRVGGEPRLVPVDALEAPLRRRCLRRLGLVYETGSPAGPG
ncbi:MAG: CapA family protein [Planctomycetes bacterium]|nr:CapA family protein [Planctomycetota bacterium]